MTTLDIDAIEAHSDAATPGPWAVKDSYGCVDEIISTCTPLPVVSASLDDTRSGSVQSLEIMGEDAEFIAHAREDVPALIARVRELEEDRRVLWEDMQRIVPELHAENDRLRAEMDSLRGLVRAHVEGMLLSYHMAQGDDYWLRDGLDAILRDTDPACTYRAQGEYRAGRPYGYYVAHVLAPFEVCGGQWYTTWEDAQQAAARMNAALPKEGADG